MTTDSMKKQHISSNQNEELAPVVEEYDQDIEEINEAELDGIAGGILARCPKTGRLIEVGDYHIMSSPRPRPM